MTLTLRASILLPYCRRTTRIAQIARAYANSPCFAGILRASPTISITPRPSVEIAVDSRVWSASTARVLLDFYRSRPMLLALASSGSSHDVFRPPRPRWYSAKSGSLRQSVEVFLRRRATPVITAPSPSPAHRLAIPRLITGTSPHAASTSDFGSARPKGVAAQRAGFESRVGTSSRSRPPLRRGSSVR